MSDNFFKIDKGIRLYPQSGAPVSPANGDVYYDSNDSKFKIYQQGAWQDLKRLIKYDATVAPTVNEDSGDGYEVGSMWFDVTADTAYICLDATVGAAVWKRMDYTAAGDLVTTTGSQTLTNKTIDGDDNTVQDLALASLKPVLADASKFLVRDASGIVISNTKAVPTGDVVGSSDSQILTNKTIDGDDNTVQDLPLTALKTNLTDASNFIVRDASGIPISNTKAVPTGAVLGTTDTQTLTNKTFDDAITVKEISTPSSPSAGYDKLYTKSDNKLYRLNSSGQESVVGSGGGGLDTLATYSSDDDNSTWTSFNNATFGTFTGSLLGTFTKQNSSSPLRGTYSYTLEAAAGVSLNDGVVSESITVPVEFRNRFLVIKAQYTYDGSDNQYSLRVWDNTNSAELDSSSVAYVKGSSTSVELIKVVFIPSTCSAIRFGFHAVAEPSASAVLKFDSIELSRDPFAYSKIYENVRVRGESNAGQALTASVTPIPFTEVTDTHGAWDGDQFTVPYSGVYSITFATGVTVGGSHQHVLYKNGTSFRRIQFDPGTTSTTTKQGSYEGYFTAGDILEIRIDQNKTLNSGAGTEHHYIEINSVNIFSDHTVSPAQSNMSDWVSYTPTFTGFGTTSSVRFRSRRMGSNLEVEGNFVVGTSTATEARISFPTTYGTILVDSLITTTNLGVGYFFHGAATTTGGSLLALGGQDYFKFTQYDLMSIGGVVPTTAANGNAVGDSGDTITLRASIPIQGWTSNVSFLGAIPIERTATVLYDTASSSTTVSNSAGTATICPLTTLTSGDFSSIASNQLSLPAGKYQIEWSMAIQVAASSSTNSCSYLRNATSSTILKYSNSASLTAPASTVLNGCLVGFYELEITSQTLLELYHIQGTGGGSGTVTIGNSALASPYATKAQINIKKVK